jgi:hypothetical protein
MIETMFEDIIEITTTEALSDLLSEYCKDYGLSPMSADELLLEVLDTATRAKAHALWLQAFIIRWEAVQADEDFEHAIAMRGEK